MESRFEAASGQSAAIVSVPGTVKMTLSGLMPTYPSLVETDSD